MAYALLQVPEALLEALDTYLAEKALIRTTVHSRYDPLIDVVRESARYAPSVGGDYKGLPPPNSPGHPRSRLSFFHDIRDTFPSHWGEYEKGVVKTVNCVLKSEIYYSTVSSTGPAYTTRIHLCDDFPEYSLHIAWLCGHYYAVIPEVHKHTSQGHRKDNTIPGLRRCNTQPTSLTRNLDGISYGGRPQTRSVSAAMGSTIPAKGHTGTLIIKFLLKEL